MLICIGGGMRDSLIYTIEQEKQWFPKDSSCFLALSKKFFVTLHQNKHITA